MGKALAVVDKIVNSLHKLDGTPSEIWGWWTCVNGEMHAVAEMYTFQRTRRIIPASHKALYSEIGDVVALDQADSPQLWKQRELTDTSISQTQTTREVDVSYPGAVNDQFADRAVRDVVAMSQMKIVQVLSQFCDGIHRGVRDLSALGEDQVPKPRRHLDNLVHRLIRQQPAVCKIQYP